MVSGEYISFYVTRNSKLLNLFLLMRRDSVINPRLKGILTSYLLIAIQAVSQLILTPLYLDRLGVDAYGLFQLLYSIFGLLIMANIGIKMIVTRYIVIYEIGNHKKQLENFLFHMLLVVTSVSLIVLVAGIALSKSLINLFPNQVTAGNLFKVQLTVMFLIASSVVKLWNEYFWGIACAKERFAIANIIRISQYLITFLVVIGLLIWDTEIFVISMAEAVAVFVSTTLMVILSTCGLKVKAKFHYWDKQIILKILKSGIMVFAGNIANFLNDRADVIILGALSTAAMVTAYSISSTIFYNFGILGSQISDVYLPRASILMRLNASIKELRHFWESLARSQLLLCGSLAAGFCALGKDFLVVWLGEEQPIIYGTTIICLFSVLISVLATAGAKLLEARLHMVSSSITTILVAVGNVVLSICLFMWIGYWGIPLGTLISNFIGRGIILPYIVSKDTGVSAVQIYFNISKRIVPCLMIAAGLSSLVGQLITPSLGSFILKGSIFVVTEGILLWIFELKAEEKNYIIHLVKRGKQNAEP